MLKIESLLSFAAVVEHGGISAAAAVKGQTPMAVSKRISNLEAQVGEALFERTQKKLVLTEFGRAFEQQVSTLLSQHEALEQWLENREGKVEGLIRVVTQAPEITSETLLPWVDEFLDKYPEVELELDIKKSRIVLPEDQYDIFWGVGDYLGQLYPGLKRRFMWSGKLGIFAAPSYLEKHPTITDVAELSRHQIIGYLYNEPPNVLLTQNPDHGEKFLHHLLPCRLRTVSGLIELAISGLGLINASEEQPDIQRALKSGELVPVLKDHWWESAAAHVYFHNTKPIPPKIRAFLDFFLAKTPEWS